MIKGYFVEIPPTLAEVLADIGKVSEEDDFDVIVNSAYEEFFKFYTPRVITSDIAEDLEKFVLHFFIMRRVGSGNIRKWRQLFRNKWNSIIPYYERLLDTQENESHYFSNPILNVDVAGTSKNKGTLDTTEDTTRNTDTERNGTTKDVYSGSDEKTHTGSDSDTANSTEINRYSDTPQGDSSKIWEVDGSGNPRLNNVYLTDIRGITDSSQRNGTDHYTESGTNAHTTDGTAKETVDTDETGKKIVDTDTTSDTDTTKKGYEGVSPVDLMLKYRESFMRIYEAIVTELEEVFYNLVEVDDIIDFV